MMRCFTMEQITISQNNGHPHEVIVLRKRSEGRLKTYISNLDIRSWGASDYERQEFIQEFINHPEWYSGISKSFYLPSSSVLAGALLAKKNSDLKKLKDQLTSQGITPSGDEPQSLQSVSKDGIQSTSDALYTEINYTEEGEGKEQPPLPSVNKEERQSTSDALYTDVNYTEAGEGKEQPRLPSVNKEDRQSTSDALHIDVNYVEAGEGKEQPRLPSVNKEDRRSTSDALHIDVNYVEAGEGKEQPPLPQVKGEERQSTSDALYIDVNYVEAGEGKEQPPQPLVSGEERQSTSDALYTDVNYVEAGEGKEQPPLPLVNEEGIERTPDGLYPGSDNVGLADRFPAEDGKKVSPTENEYLVYSPTIQEDGKKSFLESRKLLGPDELNKLKALEKENSDLKAIISRLEQERDNLKNELLKQKKMSSEQQEQIEQMSSEQDEQRRRSSEQQEQIEQMRRSSEQAEQRRISSEQAEQRRISSEQAEQRRISSEQAEQRRISSEQDELLRQRKMSKEQRERIRDDTRRSMTDDVSGCSKECLQKLIDFKERERNFLMAHLMKMDTLLTAITECSKMKEGTEGTAGPQRGLEGQAMEDLKQQIADLECELEEKDEMICSLDQQLKEALRREECLQQAMCHTENKMKEVRCRSIELEDKLMKVCRERGKLMQSFQSDQDDLERLKKENAEMSKVQKKMDEERERLKKEQEEQENCWQKCFEEMNGKLEEQEKDKERLCTQLHQYMNDEIITPKRACELQQLEELKRVCVENEEQAEKDRCEAQRAIEALECEMENLRGCLFCKNKELENLRKETKMLKECMNCLETNKNALEKTIASLREEKETMKEKWEDERLHALEVTLEKLEFEIEYQMSIGGSYQQLTVTNGFEKRASACTCAKSDTDLYHSTDRYVTDQDTECVEYNNIDECDNYLQPTGSDDFHASGCTCNPSRGDTDMSPMTDRFGTTPVQIEQDVDSRWQKRKTYERNSNSPNFMSGMGELEGDFKDVTNYEMGIWERDEIVVLKSPCK